MKKIHVLGLAALLASGTMTITAFAGWEASGNEYRYRYDSGEYARNQVTALDGAVYGFDDAGNMVTGWMKQGDGSWLLFAENGMQLYGWQQVSGNWYYLDPAAQGKMLTGRITVDGKKYIMSDSGEMKTGSIEYDGYTYYAEPDGSLRRNMDQTNNGITIRYDDEGREWYRNQENLLNNQTGGQIWLPLLPGKALDIQRQWVQDDNEGMIKDCKDELSDQYKENVKGASYKKVTEKEKKWEDKVKKRLSAMYVSEQEINDYIAEVKAGRYGKEETDEEESSYYYN